MKKILSLAVLIVLICFLSFKTNASDDFNINNNLSFSNFNYQDVISNQKGTFVGISDNSGVSIINIENNNIKIQKTKIQKYNIDLKKIIWDGKNYIAISDKSNSIFKSVDGIKWDVIELGSEYSGVYDICWNTQEYILIAKNNSKYVILKSEDMMKWEKIDLNLNININDEFKIQSSGEDYLLTNYNYCYYSKNLKNWKELNSIKNIETQTYWNGNYYLIALDSKKNTKALFTIGSDLKINVLNLPNINSVIKLIPANKELLVVDIKGIYNVSGGKWSFYKNNFIGFKSGCFDTNRIIIVGEKDQVRESKNYQTWNSNKQANYKIDNLIFDGTKYVLSGFEEVKFNEKSQKEFFIYTSLDCNTWIKIDWNKSHLTFDKTKNEIMCKMSYYDNKYYLIINDTIYQSNDLVKWEKIFYQKNYYPKDLKFLNEIYLISGYSIINGENNEFVMSSKDLKIWETTLLGKGNFNVDIIYKDNKYYLFSSQGFIFKSVNGRTWTELEKQYCEFSCVNVNGQKSFIFGNVNNDSVYLHSENFEKWTRSNVLNVEKFINVVNFKNEMYAIGKVKGNITLLRSLDGQTWNEVKEYNSTLTEKSILYSNSNHLIMTNKYGGIILISKNIKEDINSDTIIKTTIEKRNDNFQKMMIKYFFAITTIIFTIIIIVVLKKKKLI